MEEQERKRIEELTVEQFDQELISRFGVVPRVKVVHDNPHGYDLDYSTRPELNTDAFRFFSAGTFLRGLEYCHYLHDKVRY